MGDQLFRGFEWGFDRGGRGAEDPVDLGIVGPHGLYAIFGDVDVSGPHDGVEKKLTVVIVLPVGVKMSECRSNAAAGCLALRRGRTLIGPHGDLIFRTG